jgi:hypothetical protein
MNSEGEPSEKPAFDLEERTALFGEAVIRFAKTIQCRPIGNMHKTIDFIGDLKSDGCFKWHTPSHGVQKCQKAFIFGVFMRFLWDGCENNSKKSCRHAIDQPDCPIRHQRWSKLLRGGRRRFQEGF